MKASKTYYHAGMFKYLEGDKWPVMDLKSFYAAHYVIAKMECEVTKLEYQEALTSALSRAIDFEDQVNIEGIVREELGPDPWNRPLQEGLYNIPEIEVEKINVCLQCNMVGMRNCAHFDKCGGPIQLARIKSSKSEELPKEDKTAWKDVYISFNDGEGWIAFTERMSKHFTITRKS